MSDDKPRFQFHLSTLLVLTLLLGALGTLSCIENLGIPPFWFAIRPPSPGTRDSWYGFPLLFSLVSQADRFPAHCAIFVECVVADILVASGILYFAARKLEARFRQ